MLPRVVDNLKNSLAEVLRQEASRHKHLSIATGYWDLKGMLEVIDKIKDYDSVRILIGAEPLSSRRVNEMNLYEMFPEIDMSEDLEEARNSDKSLSDQLRATAKIVAKMVDDGRLEVRVCKKPFLHAKTFIFGTLESTNPVGIIGSSNFTGNGLKLVSEGGNAELNAVESEPRIVAYVPQSENQEYGHLSWFESIWNSEYATPWSGDFSRILRNSPVGDLTLGPHDAYIKTLMEYFPEETSQLPELDSHTQDILYKYQKRNASILINKLEKMGMAILADSVGLGKTITAGAVISYYISQGKNRIVIIVPASLKAQWRDDLRTVFGLAEGFDYQIISQQDLNLIKQKTLDYRQLKAEVDLFVIDEAHNLRSEGSERHQCVLEWLQDNPDSKVLMLTATPINNSLNDLTHLIRLGLKGSLDSVPVPYRKNGSKSNRLETIDFFEALNRIQRASTRDADFDWNNYKSTLISGISRYLVRSTRQGVEAEGALVSKDGKQRHFPVSDVRNASYKYGDDVSSAVASFIDNFSSTIDGIQARYIDINAITEETQRTLHPLDTVREYLGNEPLFGVIPNMLQLITLLGFTPYRTEIYKHQYYGRTPEEIKALRLKGKELTNVNIQLAAHNILQVTWLKRLESSTNTLRKSVEKYRNRLARFIEYLDKGYVLSFRDISVLESEYGEDIDKAFDDYDKYLEELDAKSDEEIKKYGIEKREARPDIYNVSQMRKDAERDMAICGLMDSCLGMLYGEKDSKMVSFSNHVRSLLEGGLYGKKVLVFSFFADTVNYLKESLPLVLGEGHVDIMSRAEFISGQSKSVEDITKRFSPISKKYTMKESDKPVDFLFATDVLSEGQNLQDAAILINYDLHWNPVRMIQRNGRINRLGSSYDKVLISNMTPEDHIELYLRLVSRLESKIATIKNSVGLDQGVLSNDDINPIEFVENMKNLYGKDGSLASKTMQELDKEDDILSWTNDHVFTLREFLHDATDAEKKRIKGIPLGKWTYLPAASDFHRGHSMSLQRAIGKTSITGQPISQAFFLDSDMTGFPYVTEIMDDQVALDFIRALPEDNEQRIDEIDVDRQAIAKRASNTAKRRAESGDISFKLKPSMEEALDIMQNNFRNPEDAPVRPIVERNLKDSRHKRQFEKLVREIRQEYKADGFVNVPTIKKFNKLISELEKVKTEDTIVDKVFDVLYYVK